MSEPRKDPLHDFQVELWGERVELPDDVFDTLLAEHQTSLESQIGPAMNMCTRDILAEIRVAMQPDQDPSQSIKRARDTLFKIARDETPLSEQQMANMFFDDGHLGGDIKAALSGSLPADNPNRFSTFSSLQLLDVISKYIASDFWDNTTEMSELKAAADIHKDIAYNPNSEDWNSRLLVTFWAQRFARSMDSVAYALASSEQINLATAATAFRRYAEQISNSIVLEVRQELESSADLLTGLPQPPKHDEKF